MFWEGVGEDVLADLLTAVALGSVTVAVAYWRFSGHFERVRQLAHPGRPTDQVVVAAGPELLESQPRVNSPTPFRSPITPSERDRLVEFYQRLSRTITWNGQVVRLDQLEPTLEVSVVEYWDLVATNLTAFFSSTSVLSVPASLAAMSQWVTLRGPITKVVAAARPAGRHPSSVGQILTNRHLANVIGAAVLVIDPGHRALLSRQPRNRATARGAWFPSAIGTVELADLDAPAPFDRAARRILAHHAQLSPARLHLEAVVLPRHNLQPYFCFLAEVDQPLEELLPELGTDLRPKPGAPAGSARYRLLDVGDARAIVRFCRVAQQSQTAAYLLWRAGSRTLGEAELVRRWRHHRRWAVNPGRGWPS